MIVVLSAASGEVERELLAGIEEEGVPYSVAPAGPGADTAELARRAAMASPLRVGVAIGPGGDICVQHAQLSDPLPEMSSGVRPDAATARMLGHNAARIVVGLPLKPDN